MAIGDLTAAAEAGRARLEQDPLDAEAARELRTALGLGGGGTSVADGARRLPGVQGALAEVCTLLDGGGPESDPDECPGTPRPLGRAEHEALVIHPREKQGRQHQLTSLLGRVLHLLEGSEIARVVSRVTEQATPATYPRLCGVTAECARALGVEPPAIHVASGEERLFTAYLDRAPFLCVHRAFEAEAGRAATGPASRPFTGGELRCAVGHLLEHIKGGHAALLQISPELLEGLVLDQLPFLVRTPIRLASKAIGWSRANVAMRKAGELLPERSRAQRLVNTVGELLPDRAQETVLPETVHEWVWSWIQGVEYSADRAGLLLGGSVTAATTVMLRLSPHFAPRVEELPAGGTRRLLQERADADRPTADRLRELLRFAVSREYLEFVARAEDASCGQGPSHRGHREPQR